MNANTPTPSAGETASNALAKLREFLRVKDTDTLARLQPDSHAIAHSSGSWSNTVSLTWGDLREIERELHALQSAPVGEAAKQPFTLPDYRNAAVAAECGTGAISTAQWLVYELSLDDIGYDAVLIRQSIERLVNEQTRHFQQVVAENEALRKQWADTDENAVRAVKLASAQQDTIATLNKELEGAKAFADEEEKRCAAFQATDAQLRSALAQCQRERDEAKQGWQDCSTSYLEQMTIAAEMQNRALEAEKDRDALKARVEELEKLNVASYEQFPVRMTKEAYIQDANTRDGLRASLQAAHATITALREAGGGLARAFEDTCNMLIDAELALARYGAHDEAEQLLKRRRAIPDVSTRWSALAPSADGKTGGATL